MKSLEEMQPYFSGKKLYGNDFGAAKIEEWFADEKEAYAELINRGNTFNFDLMNVKNGFKYLPKNVFFNKVVSFGGADGEEILPIINQINNITIIDPSDSFKRNELNDKPLSRIKPSIQGNIEFENDSLDLITCFGVLHHIPNVSHVISEFHRCLKKNGILIIREPINSMGDWRFPRKLTTKRERGIPLNLFREWIAEKNFSVIKETLCEFSVMCKFPGYKFLITKSGLFITIDKFISKLFAWNYNYHAKKFFDKFKPLSVYYVLKK